MASGNRVAFVPPAGAVSEFKVETANFDAQQGHTGGANVNVSIKSGTNQLKGEGYYYYRDEKLANNDFFLDLQDRPKSPLDYARFGGHAGAPIIKDKTFIFGAIEWLYDEFAEPGQFSVPTEKMRNGDFSELLSAGILIYDPLTAVRLPNGRIERQPFPGNVIPASRISPIAREYLKYYPLPNQAGNAQQMLNYSSPNPRTDDFYSISLRGDHNINQNQRIFARYTRNDRQEARDNWAGEVNGIRPIGNYLYRINDGVTVDHVWNMSGTSLLNLRGGWQRFQEPNVRQHEGEFDPASLGFSPATVSYFGDANYLPCFNIDGDFSDIGENKGGTAIHSIYSFQPTFTKLMGKHSIRTGYDFRMYQEEGFGPGAQAGQYNFNTNYTRQFDNSSAAVTGQQLAAMMLGQPTGGFIDRNAERMNCQPYHGVFVQDDWTINDRLTVNLGLRYEYQSAPYDTDNRNQRGWDPAATLAISSAAQAAYAANPIPEVAPSAFQVRGGILFADDGNRTFWKADKNNFQPRVGFAYKIDDKTVARGGFAIYTVPFVIAGVRQPGFSQATNIVPTNDTGLTFVANLANPFPSGVLDPPGSSLGREHVPGAPTRPVLAGRRRQEPPERPVGLHRAARVARAVAGGTRLRRQPRLGPDGSDDDQRRPGPVPVHLPVARPGHDQLPDGERHEPVRRPAAGHQPERVDGAATTAVASVRAVRGRPELELQRLHRLPRVPEPRRTPVHEGLHAALRLHLVEVHRAGVVPEPHRRGTRGAAGQRGHPAPVLVLRRLGTAVRQGPQVSAAT